MQRTLALGFAGLMLVALLAPSATASVTYNGALPFLVSPLGQVPPFLPSDPVLQSNQQFNLNLQPGDEVSLSLTWTSTSSLPVANDLDITLLLPSSAPVPLPVPPTDPVGTLTAIVTSRAARQTCTDAAAESNNHQLLGGPASESIAYTVPAGGETGTYAALVRGFVLSQNQPFTLTATVIRGGVDVTAGAFTALPPNVFITTNPYCQLI